MKIQRNDLSEWFDSLEDCKPEFTPIKVWNLLQFFTLAGKRTVLNKDNLIPIPELSYVIFSPQEERYYLRQYRNYSVDELYFYRRTLDFSGDDKAIENLRIYVMDGNVHLLLTEGQVADMKDMLERVRKANMQAMGELKYKTFIRILDINLHKEDYSTYYVNQTGYKTVMNQWDNELSVLWKSCLKN